jgi:hypothetical protein
MIKITRKGRKPGRKVSLMPHFIFVGLLLVAVLMTFYKIPLASSQGLQIVSNWVDGELPVEDPASPLWQNTTAVEVPLSAQNVAKPFLLDSKIKSVTARSLHNGSQLAVLVEWADATQDDSTVQVDQFRDAVALQFPQVELQPFFCMGQQGGNVNLWHWKADWQADLTARQEMEDEYPNMYVDYYPYAEAVEGEMASVADYKDINYLPAMKAGNLLAVPTILSPVEDLNAGGFGSLTSQPIEGQNVQGYGSWKDGKWQVIFSRDMESAEPDDVSFQSSKVYSLAFAVWDGDNEERNGEKSTSQWLNFQVSSAPRTVVEKTEAAAEVGFLTTANITYLLLGVTAVLFMIGALIYWKLPE